MYSDLHWIDLHLHSHFSWATSPACTLPHYYRAAQLKGLRVIGTGDVTHPGWLREIQAALRPAPNGLWELNLHATRDWDAGLPARCRNRVEFALTGEVSCVYRRGGRSRRVHHLIVVSSLERAARLQARLEPWGRLAADGRPTLKMDSRELLSLLLEVDDRSALAPAHIWTPWYSLLGSKSGFDSLEECFGDLSPEIGAMETGLSADPAMLGRVRALCGRKFISNSDAHSPAKLGREATALRGTPSFDGIWKMLRGHRLHDPAATIEWPPALGKYYGDGHRKCDFFTLPSPQDSAPRLCPVCSRPLTQGVLSRVEQLADSAESSDLTLPPALPTIPLPDIVAKTLQRHVRTRAVQQCSLRLLERLGPELTILHRTLAADLMQGADTAVAQAILAVRAGHYDMTPGYDGRFGEWQPRRNDTPRMEGHTTCHPTPPRAPRSVSSEIRSPSCGCKSPSALAGLS